MNLLLPIFDACPSHNAVLCSVLSSLLTRYKIRKPASAIDDHPSQGINFGVGHDLALLNGDHRWGYAFMYDMDDSVASSIVGYHVFCSQVQLWRRRLYLSHQLHQLLA